MPPHPDDAGTDSTGAGRYGASADYQTLYRQVGITAAAVDAWPAADPAPGTEDP